VAIDIQQDRATYGKDGRGGAERCCTSGHWLLQLGRLKAQTTYQRLMREYRGRKSGGSCAPPGPGPGRKALMGRWRSGSGRRRKRSGLPRKRGSSCHNRMGTSHIRRVADGNVGIRKGKTGRTRFVTQDRGGWCPQDIKKILSLDGRHIAYQCPGKMRRRSPLKIIHVRWNSCRNEVPLREMICSYRPGRTDAKQIAATKYSVA